MTRHHSRSFCEPLESRFLLAGITYSGPIIITKGGTYSGNWESTDPSKPAVEIRTSEAVTIQNSNIRSKNDCIRNRWGSSNLKVINTNGYGVNPNVAGQGLGRFIDLEFFVKADIENCYAENTAGIYLYDYRGAGAAGNTAIIKNNFIKNTQGRKSDGNNGFQTAYNRVSAIQLNGVHGITGTEIAWNKIVNEPYKSHTEDTVSLHLTTGTSGSPIRVHDNFLQGAYANNPATDTYSGGGIMLADGATSDMTKTGGFIKAYNNVVISTSNYGMAVSSGHDIEIYNNRLVMSGKLADGTAIKVGDAGIYIRNYPGYSVFKNNWAHDNVVGWGRADGQTWNYSLTDATQSGSNNQNLAGPISQAMETTEYNSWVARCAAAGISVGPSTSQPSSPTNIAPTVDAGTDQTITSPTNSVTINATVTDDGLGTGLWTTWSKMSGPGNVAFGNAQMKSTTATFSSSGSYVLRCTANDGELTSASDVAITVNAVTPTTSVTALKLIDTLTGQPVSGVNLVAGGTTNLNLATLPKNLNLRADTTPGTVGSVKFGFDSNPNFKIENTAPYAFNGDTNGVFNPFTFTTGTHTVKATAFTGASAGGTAGATVTFTLNITNTAPPPAFSAQPISTSINLIDATTGISIAELTDGAVIQRSSLPPRINVQATTSGAVSAVNFGLNGISNFRKDDTGPFTLFDESNAPSTAPGVYKLIVTPFADDGSAGDALTLRVTIV